MIGTVAILVSAVFGYQWIRHADFSLGVVNNIANATLQTASSALSKTSQITSSTKHPRLDTVVSVTQHLSGASEFITLFKSSGVADHLTGKGPYTIFVPTNKAFSHLPPGTLSEMSATQKLRLVQYHIITGRAVSAETQIMGTILSLSGDALNFSFGTDHIPMVNSAIFMKKYRASNGIVYLIDNVLLPPLYPQ
jgi:uncharacterized surface protein with fasciclin (FAS1) repeats